MPFSAYSDAVAAFADGTDFVNGMDYVIQRLQTEDMIYEERILKCFTRRNLTAFMKQHDSHHAAGTLVESVLRSTVLKEFCDLGIKPVILRLRSVARMPDASETATGVDGRQAVALQSVKLTVNPVNASEVESTANMRRIAQYLCHTMDCWIICWGSLPLHEFQAVHLLPPPEDDSLPVFPQPEPLVLAGHMDVAHATNMIQRKSVTGLLFMAAGGLIAYKSKLQVSVATAYKSKDQVFVKTSSTELYAVVDAAKIGNYLRSVLDKLGFVQNGPTWCTKEEIKLAYIPTKINVADNLTKGSTLHGWNVRQAIRPTYATFIDSVPCTE
jgi:hypothetical protein